MNRLGFLKRLIGGAVAAPLVVKALAEEQPKFTGFTVVGMGTMAASSYPCATTAVGIGISNLSEVKLKMEHYEPSKKPKRRHK